MPYTRTTWVDNGAPDLDAANLNNLETGVSNAPYGPDASANFVPVWNGSAWTYSKVTESQITAATITNASLSASAAIAVSKLADPTTGKFVGSSGGAAAAVFPPGHEWDYVSSPTTVSVTATTEGTAQTLVDGTSLAYDGTTVWVHFHSPEALIPATHEIDFVILRDSTVLGQFFISDNNASASGQLVNLWVRDTPSAATHQYHVKAFVSAGTGTVKAGAGGSGTACPMFVRVVKA